VARALQRAHDRGIIHRDLKPDNIFIVQESDGEIAKVLDFGVAKTLGALGTTSGVKTSTGTLLGTPYYMSPEQALAKEGVNHKADIWSFGIIAYECLTGVRPFETDSLAALFVAICQAKIPVPSSVADVPRGFDAWFAKAATRDLAARFDSASEAAAQLRSLCGAAPRAPAQLSLAEIPAEPVAVVSHKFEETAPPSSVTIPGLHKTPTKRILAIVGIAALVVAASAVFALKPRPATSSPTDSSAPPALPSAVESLHADVSPSVASATAAATAAATVVAQKAPPIILLAKPVASATPQPGAGAPQRLQKGHAKEGAAPAKPTDKPRAKQAVDLGF
jgi:serine/threonine-protein kinase